MVVVRGGSDGDTGVGERTRSGSIFSGDVDDPDATGAVGGVAEMEAAAETFEIELELVGAALAGAATMGTTGVILRDVELEVSAGEADVGPTAAAAMCLDVATGTSSGALSIIRAVSASLEAELTDRVTE